VSDPTQFEDQVRRALATAVRDQPMPALPTGPDYRRAARRRVPVFPAVAAAAAAVVLLAGVVVAIAVRGPSGIPQPQGGPGAWPARGSLAGDVTLTTAAMRAWEAALIPGRELPHHDVTVMYAERTSAGDVVVLTGVDALGHRRIAEFGTDVTSTTVFRHRLHLVADLLAPAGDAAGLVAIDAPRHTPRKTDDDLLVVIAAPGTTHLQWRDESTRWAALPATNGAGALVHVQHMMTTFVRAGTDGDGVQTMGRFYPVGPPAGLPIVHDLDPDERPPASSAGPIESCDGNQCSASVGGTVTGHLVGPKGSWHNLLDGGPTTAHEWWEFGGEVVLYTDTFLPNEGNMSGPGWSAVLPDETGIYLEHFKPGNDSTHLLAYVDRPEWAGGAVVDVVPRAGALPALALEVPTPRGRTLDVVVTDGLTPQWSLGSGPWHPMTVHDNAGTAVVPAGANLRWRVVDVSGAVVASGVPHAVTAR
jgi:hypothetical protein